MAAVPHRQHSEQDIADFLGDSQRVLVLVNDYTRPTPNAPILAALAGRRDLGPRFAQARLAPVGHFFHKCLLLATA